MGVVVQMIQSYNVCIAYIVKSLDFGIFWNPEIELCRSIDLKPSQQLGSMLRLDNIHLMPSWISAAEVWVTQDKVLLPGGIILDQVQLNAKAAYGSVKYQLAAVFRTKYGTSPNEHIKHCCCRFLKDLSFLLLLLVIYEKYPLCH